jgi:hypothetical protein
MPSYKQSFFQALCQIDDEAERQERQNCVKTYSAPTTLLLFL